MNFIRQREQHDYYTRTRLNFRLPSFKRIGANILLHFMPSRILTPLSLVQTDATLLANNSQHSWMLHVASVCTPCCMLLDVVVCCCAKFETGQTCQPTTPNISFVPWSPKRSATMLDPFAQLFQHCWGHARSLRMSYKDLWVPLYLLRLDNDNTSQVIAKYAHLMFKKRKQISSLYFSTSITFRGRP